MPKNVVEYREIAGFPGYRVGDDGTVWSCWNRGGRRAQLTDTWRPLIQSCTNSGGYYDACLCASGKVTQHVYRSIHRIVLDAFVGPRPAGMDEARHLNGIKTDNRLVNLAWGTRKENAADRVIHGTENFGEKNGFAKLTRKQVQKIRKLRGKVKQKDIAAMFRVSDSAVSNILHGHTWSHLPEEA